MFATSNNDIPYGYCCRMNFYQHFVIFRDWFFYFLHLKNIGLSIFCENNYFHEIPQKFVKPNYNYTKFVFI